MKFTLAVIAPEIELTITPLDECSQLPALLR